MAAKNSMAVEVDGLSLTVDKDALEDIETLDLLDELSEGNVLKLKKLIVTVVGNDGWETVRDHLKGDSGRVNAGDAAEFFKKLLEEVGAKN